MDTLYRAANIEFMTEEAYRKVDEALRSKNIDFSRESHKYQIPNFQYIHPTAISVANNALKGTEFHATEIPYREIKDKKPEFMAVIHKDDETYTFCM